MTDPSPSASESALDPSGSDPAGGRLREARLEDRAQEVTGSAQGPAQSPAHTSADDLTFGDHLRGLARTSVGAVTRRTRPLLRSWAERSRAAGTRLGSGAARVGRGAAGLGAGLGRRIGSGFGAPRGGRAPGSRPAWLRLPRPRWRHLGDAAVLGLAGLGLFLAYCLFTLPLNGGLQVEATPSAMVLEADAAGQRAVQGAAGQAAGQVFATRGVFKGDKLTAADLPPQLAQAVVAIEDRRFHQHWGVDLRGTLRAAVRNLQAGGTREGGSTLTQQLARLMFLSPDRNLKRKVQEAMLALWLERQLTKEEILVRYLNTAYFGAGAYGVDAASKRYFGKKAKELSLPEAAMLAGLVRSPSQLAPTRNLDGARERAEVVLAAMVETGAITPEQSKSAQAQPVTLRLPPETPPGANYFVDLVAGDTRRLLGPAPADVTLRTTLDLDLQRLAESAVINRLEAEGMKRKIGQGALVALAPDGAVLALVGGRDYEASQFNRATQAKRQPGSLFKLFVYLAAFQKGFNPGSTLVDQPTQVGDWEPQNANGRFRGRVDLRTAFAQSLNTIAVQLTDQVGVPAVIETAQRLGVQSPLPNLPSLALGSAEVTLMEMTRAFAAVAAGVQSLEPYTVRSIRGVGERGLYTRPAAGAEVSGSLGESRAMMLDLLQAAVRDGTGKAARLPNIPVAGKTGTTQEHRDAWFVGFTPDLVVGVWVGNDDNAPMDRVTGGEVPAAIWRDFVSRATPLLAKKRSGAAVAQASLNAPAAPPQTPAQAPAQSPPQAAVTGSVPRTEGPRGVPEVVDTGTLEVRGQVVRLLGVDGEKGRFRRQLARYLRGREVACEPAGSAEVFRCRADGEDLSEAILAAGGGRALPDAPPELLAAEEQARFSRQGVWRRGG